MSLNKKKSRPITVDSLKYRYQVSTTKINNDWDYKLNITIQYEENGGCLQITGLLTRDFWLDFPKIKVQEDIEHYPIIKPNHISKIIILSRIKGWKPKENSKLFKLKLRNEDIFK